VRQREPRVIERWKATLAAGLIACCPVAALEILTGARDEDGFAKLDRALSALPQAPVTSAVCAAAVGASRELPAADYLIAADGPSSGGHLRAVVRRRFTNWGAGTRTRIAGSKGEGRGAFVCFHLADLRDRD